MDDEMEYRVPARVLANRDPIILNKLSLREFFQWAVFFILIYFSFNALPLDFVFKLVIGASIATFGALFIHAPVNGLAGVEWAYIYLRFAAEKKRHKTVPPVNTYPGRKPVFTVSMSLTSSDPNRMSKQVVGQPRMNGKETIEDAGND